MIKLLFDQNISHRILESLPDEFSHSTTIKKEGLVNASDMYIWKFAQENHYTIVTQDSDFNDLNLLHGFPPKIIWVRVGNVSTKIISILLYHFKTEIISFIKSTTYGCMEIPQLPKA